MFTSVALRRSERRRLWNSASSGAVADTDEGGVLQLVTEQAHDGGLGIDIERGGRFVEDDDVGLLD